MQRRKHPRYRIDNNSIVAHGKQVGKIVDLSMGGLCCQCVVNGKELVPPAMVDIFRCEKDFKVFDAPIEVRHIRHVHGIILETMRVRYCHTEFQNLSGAQKEQIDNLIHSYVG